MAGEVPLSAFKTGESAPRHLSPLHLSDLLIPNRSPGTQQIGLQGGFEQVQEIIRGQTGRVLPPKLVSGLDNLDWRVVANIRALPILMIGAKKDLQGEVISAQAALAVAYVERLVGGNNNRVFVESIGVTRVAEVPRGSKRIMGIRYDSSGDIEGLDISVKNFEIHGIEDAGLSNGVFQAIPSKGDDVHSVGIVTERMMTEVNYLDQNTEDAQAWIVKCNTGTRRGRGRRRKPLFFADAGRFTEAVGFRFQVGDGKYGIAHIPSGWRVIVSGRMVSVAE